MATTDQPGPDRGGAGHGGVANGPDAEEASEARPVMPLAGRKRRSPIWARLLVAFGLVLALLSSGMLVTVKVLTSRYEGTIGRAPLLAPEARESAPLRARSTITGPLNYLLIGSDFRNRNPDEGQRSDTIILVHVPRSLDRAYLISIPRDLLVRIPAFPATGFAGDETKINAAYQYGGGGLGGAQLVSATLTQLIGVRFHGAAIINFDGFRRAVDVLGGVYLCVDRTVESNHLAYDRNGKVVEVFANEEGVIQGIPPGGRPYVFEAGCRTMEGRVALDYARIRYGLPRGDYDRQHHQQQFLKAVFAEALRDGIVTNPIKLDEFLRAIGSTLTVDTGETPLADLAFGLRHVTPGTFAGLKVPSYPDTIGGVSYILPEASASTLYKAIREDTLDAWMAANPQWVNQL